MNSALLGILAAVTWGIHDFIGRFSSRAIGQLITTLGLALSGLAALSVYGLWQGISLPSDAWNILLCSIAGGAYALATLSLFAAYRIGSMSIVSPIAGSYPAIAVCFGFFAGSRPGAIAWLAIIAVIVGSLQVSSAGKTHEDAGHIEAGQLGKVLTLAVATSLLFAASLIAGQVAAPLTGEVATTWLARMFAVAAVVPFFVIRSMRGTAPFNWWPVLVVMGLLDTAAMLSIFAAGNLTLPELAIVLGGSFGAVVTLLAWIFLKEPVTPAQWAGIVMICCGAGVLSAGL